MERRTREMQGQIEMLTRLVGEGRADTTRESDAPPEGDRDRVKLTKLTDSDDIESYLTTFERMMTAYNAGP